MTWAPLCVCVCVCVCVWCACVEPVSGDLYLQRHLGIQQVLVVPEQLADLLLGYLQIQPQAPDAELCGVRGEMRRISGTQKPSNPQILPK